MDKAKVISKLNEIVRHEWTGVVQYTQHSFLVQDLWREVYTPFFRKGAEESLHHAHMVGDKIVALGGTPTVERGEVRQSTDLREMLRYDVEVERGAVRLYGEALALCQDDHPASDAGEHHPRRAAGARNTWRKCCSPRSGPPPPRVNGRPRSGSLAERWPLRRLGADDAGEREDGRNVGFVLLGRGTAAAQDGLQLPQLVRVKRQALLVVPTDPLGPALLATARNGLIFVI